MKQLVLVMTLAILASCGQEKSTEMNKAPGIDLTMMDTSVSPSQDFFKFVNGSWLENTEIPADRGRWGSFDELRKMTSDNMLGILEGSGEKEFDKESDQFKAYTFYQTAMDTNRGNQAGTDPIDGILKSIETISSVKDLQAFIEGVGPEGLAPFYRFSVNPDLRNSKVYAPYLGPGSLGLPDKDYYVKNDDESVRLRTQYKEHVAKMLPFVGYTNEEATVAADNILAFETKMAEPRLNKVQRRNPLLMYNKRSIAEIQEMAPQIDWSSYFENIGASDLDTVIVTQPKYIETLSQLLTEDQVANWKDYMRWTTLNRASAYLSQEIDEANFEFYGKVLRGTEEQRPRQERVIDVCNFSLGEALGKLYVEEHFPPEAKERARKMVENLILAYNERIKALEWMTDETKEKALEKLNSTTIKIGYPNKWKDYSEMEVSSSAEGGTYAENMRNVARFNYKKDIERIGKEVDATEWFMAPQVVNAYYNPLQNEIVFPAAILQPPFFNFHADEAVNYGGIGAVIGHEISHGFDDQGSRFDAEGNMNNWWTDEDREQFEALNKELIAQFDAYEPLPGVNVNGAFTLGENIGDLGGINAAYDGLQRHLEESGNPGLIDGYTPEQRFFISWGTIWRTKYRDEALKTQIKTDPHSPAMYRAIGPLSNLDAFYDAFDIKEGDETFKADSSRVRIW